MSSIRKRLVIWLLLGLALLWATAGAGVYYAVRQGEIARLDARLGEISNGVRFFGNMAIRDRIREAQRATGGDAERRERPPQDNRGAGPAGGADRWGQFFQEGGREYFAVTGHTRPEAQHAASPSLGENTLAVPELEDGAEQKFYDTQLDDGTHVRAMSFRFRTGFGRGRPRPGEEGARRPNVPVDAVVAVDAEPVRATLTTLLFGIAGVGCLAAFASVGLVHLALRDGLKPLDELGDRLAEVDARSLGDRFSSKSMPTELAPVCDRLNALMARLETSFERERRFSADLAHELRTPVAELRTMSEVALRWPEGGDREQSQQTLEVAEQMGNIIESLLTLGRLENGHAEPEVEEVDLGELITSAWKPFATATAEKNVVVEQDLQPGAALSTDPKMLRLIVTNLFSNAADYTPEGGSITIAASPGVLEVCNDAPDLDSGKVTHLFERFWRADGSRTDGSHSGLGLSLARACARALGLELAARYASGRVFFRLAEKISGNLPTSSPDNVAGLE